jgi:hypothetical protein
LLGVLIGLLLARYFLREQVNQAQTELRAGKKEQAASILSALGKTPKPQDLNRLVNRMEENNSSSKKNFKRKKPKRKK